MEKVYKNCQSCGMPLRKSPNGGGTNADGSISTTYCSHCFENGSFTRPDVTADEMQQIVIGKMKEMKIPGFLAKFFAKGVPNLRRWKN
ncbi:zinc ribbon domain-containing protein [Flavobacterium silvaticum]|uniref:Putative zinc ribbon domain-containing protein n=1 Tax=Flavobacterium silvaticum TaxID=1852020 RepID=A0A972FT54_9FLAO|nr:zinc ribbon domain-containing protein [Flavobacterium silvaticum]NMH28894.1 hypothetical protein [Flavobacterium silvaticum]